MRSLLTSTHFLSLIAGLTLVACGDNAVGFLPPDAASALTDAAIGDATRESTDAAATTVDATNETTDAAATTADATSEVADAAETTADAAVHSLGLTGVIAGGWEHTCALVNGGVECWGSNQYDQLGNDSMTNSSVPVPVTGLTSGVQAISAGAGHTCALVNGGVQCWGFNESGQLGNNSTTNSTVPVQVVGLTSGVQALPAHQGGAHSCALVNGGVVCWGDNSYGELGNNTMTNSSVPVAVTGLTSGVQAIAVGQYHSCALLENGSVQCWGFGDFGELGNSSTGVERSAVPVAVTGLTSGVQVIDAGDYHTCAVVNGGVQCWGWNQNGQIGNNSTTNASAPVAVIGLSSGVQGVATGFLHTCALTNGGVQCWGGNDNGQLGNDSTTESDVPVAVSGLASEVQGIFLGGYHACVLDNGIVQCWGANESGELGDDSTTDSDVPVTVSL